MLGTIILVYFYLSSSKSETSLTGKLLFRPLLHQPRIYSGAPSGVHVTTVHAYDPENPRKKVQYNLPNVFDFKIFVVDQISGNLTTSQPITKNIGDTYEVMVAAVSQGSSELEHLQIAVTEFNQFAPYFEKRSYFIDMHPKTAINSTILHVKATDNDPAPMNAEIYYKMDQNLTSKYFSLNYVTGELILIQEINETGRSNISFGIFAEDGGSPKRWDYVPVYINLKNISVPPNLEAVNISYSSAAVCWEEPYYGEVSGYSIRYYPKALTFAEEVNVTVDYDSDLTTCQEIKNLNDDTEYGVQVYGWNRDEKGQLSPPLYFRTTKNWCKAIPCKHGLCESLLEDPSYICKCLPGYYGHFCEFFNPCIINPCGSNGKCRNTSESQYVCTCFENYTGPNCSSYSPCARNPYLCENGGTCEMTIDNAHMCICTDGFFGSKCENRDPCFSKPCQNGGTCQMIFQNSFKCLCPRGFVGKTCEQEINYCESSPCKYGATCVNHHQTFSCICSVGFTGDTCNITMECPEEKIGTTGNYHWNATKLGTTVLIKCLFGTLDSLNKEGFAKRKCILRNGTVAWSDIDTTECKTKDFILVDEIVDELHNITNNPQSLDVEAVETTLEGLITIANYATKDKKFAQNMVDIISNVLEVNDTILKETDSGSFDNVLKSIENFASKVQLEPGQHLSLTAKNIRIESMVWHPDLKKGTDDDHIELTAPVAKEVFEDKRGDSKDLSTIQGVSSLDVSKTINNTEEMKHLKNTKYAEFPSLISTTESPEGAKFPVFQVLVPKEALQEAHRKLETNVRIKFVVYYNDKLFRTHTVDSSYKSDTEKEPKAKNSNKLKEPVMETPVLQISVGNLALSNLLKPLVYILPLATKRKASCVFWNDTVRMWSTRGLETNQTFEKIICKSSHMTAFSVLLDMTPDDKPDNMHDNILSIMSYAGSSLSVLGLTATIVTYSLFRCLNRDHPGKILLNLCFSLLMMNTAFLVGSSNIIDNRKVCASVAIFIHYFVLTSLFWMCAEAINMYQLLVHVFASSETHFMLKRFCFAWGIPFIFVSVTAAVSFEAYDSNTDSCVLSAQDPWVYYCSFMAPSCLILLANVFIFLRVSKVIFTPKLTARTSSPNQNNLVTAAQVRGAFTVMVLLGTTWVFGTLAVGKIKIIFQYIFCISNSLQGFLIFLVRCLLYPEARNAWIYLLRTGKLKTHRGVLPPGTVSLNSLSTGKRSLSPNATFRSESFDSSTSAEIKNFSREQVNGFVRNLPNVTSFRGKREDKLPDIHRFVYTSHAESSTNSNKRGSMHHPHDADYKNSGLTEMNRNCDKGRINELNALRMRHHQGCQEKKYSNVSSFDKRLEVPVFGTMNAPSIKKLEIMKFTASVDPIVRGEYNQRASFEQKRDRSISVDITSTHRESDDNVLESTENILKCLRSKKNKKQSFLSNSPKNRSMSLDVGTSSSIDSFSRARRAHVKRNKKSRTDSIYLEVDDVHSEEGSSSTDVDDLPPEPNGFRPSSSSEKKNIQTGSQRDTK